MHSTWVKKRFNNWTVGFKGVMIPRRMAIIKLTISPNFKLKDAVTYFCTFPKILLPSSTANTMVEKLSSINTKSLAFCVTAVPLRPMATPTSAHFSAGASLTPSPVMATTCPEAIKLATMATLSLGKARQKQRTEPINSCSSCGGLTSYW